MLEKLYKVVLSKDDLTTIELANKCHPIFKAHFPTFPILPGFCQIEIYRDFAKAEIKNLKYCKFIDHIYPDDCIDYFYEKKSSGTKVTLKKEGKKISEFLYE